MSESTDMPAAQASMPPASTNGEGAAASAPEGASDGTWTDRPSTYANQIRRDPEYAERMLRKFQGERDHVQAELDKLGGVKQLLDQGMTPDQLVQSAQQVNWINSRPEVLAAIQSTLNGGSEPSPSTSGRSSGTDDDDLLLTDEERAMRAEVAGLRAQVQALSGRAAQTETSFGMQAVKTNLEKVAAEIGLPPNVMKRIEKSVTQHITQLGAKHQAGDQTALGALQNLTGPNANQAMRALVGATLFEQAGDIDEIAQYRALRRTRGVESLRTDGLSGVATTGTEPPPEFSSVEEAMEWSLKNPDAHDSW